MAESPARQQLERLLDDLEAVEHRARRRDEPEDWHKLRTTSRRLRGALHVFEDLIPVEDRASLSRKAKVITRTPGEVRDLDVAIGWVRDLRRTSQGKSERAAARDMIDALARRRKKRSRALRRALAKERTIARFCRLVREALEAGASRERGPAGQTARAAEQALARAAQSLIDHRAAVRSWQDVEEIHDLRVAVKKYRAALLAMHTIAPAPPEIDASLETLQGVQTILGEHHDWSEVARLLERRRKKLVARHEATPRLLRGYARLILRARQQQRERFSSYRRRLHRDLLGSLPRPVLLAS